MKNILFYCFVFYYLVLNYFLPANVERFSVYYFLLTIPAVLFVGLFSQFLAKPYSAHSLLLFLYFLLIFVISIVRLDSQTILTSFFLLATLIAILNSQVHLKLRVINLFYLLAALGSIISFHLGVNEFGYIPRLTHLSQVESGDIGPRISLFPLVPESAFFSLLIIILNYYYNNKTSKYFFYLIGGYFLFFSGGRTAILILVFFVAFEVISRYVTFRSRKTYLLLNTFFLVVFLAIVSFKDVALYVSKTSNPLIKAILLREQQSVSSTSKIADVSTRIWIWNEHYKIFRTNPLFGIGTYELSDHVHGKTMSHHSSTGSESFLTAWLARVGISALLWLVFLFQVQQTALRNKNPHQYFFCLFFLLVLLAYGSFTVPYNFMFLLMAVSLNGSTNDRTHIKGKQFQGADSENK